MSRRPWDRPQPLPVGDTDCDVIYLAVGRALSAWAEVEEQLSMFFVVVINAATTGDPAIAAYSTIDSARSRVAMVRAAADALFHKSGDNPLAKETRQVLEACQGWAERRNDIAHGSADMSDDKTCWFLYPMYFTKKRSFHEPPKFRYAASQIEEFATAFFDLGNRLATHTVQLQKVRLRS